MSDHPAPVTSLRPHLGPGALRYALALTVVLFHGTRFVPLGHTAVYLFFVLSGYWMSRTYRLTYSKTVNVAWTYALSRTWRILPLYLTTLGSTLLMYAAYAGYAGHAPSDALQLAHDPWVGLRNAIVVGLHDYSAKIIVPAWSLDIELRFYAVLPLLIALRAVLGGRALAAAGALSVVAVALRVANGSTFGLEYLIAFVAGMALDRGSDAPVFSLKQTRLASALAIAVFALPYAWRAYGDAIFWHRDRGLYGITLWEAHNVLLAVLLVPYVDRNVHEPSSARDRRLGHAAYSLYLVHWGLLCIYGASVVAVPALFKALGFAMYVGAACACAWLLERGVDRPSEVLRRRWLHSRMAGTQAHSPSLLPRT